MISRSECEKLLYDDVKELSDSDLFKVVKTVHFFKKEILQKEHGDVSDILKFAGIWKDLAQNKAKIFENIIKERDKFSEGRTIFD